jgi:hypothetical protein
MLPGASQFYYLAVLYCRMFDCALRRFVTKG